MERELNVISIQKNKALNKANTNYVWVCNHLIFVLFHSYVLEKKCKGLFVETNCLTCHVCYITLLTEGSNTKQFGYTTS